MKLPIISVDGLDVVLFESITRAEDGMEPEDICDPGVELFDADGNLLSAVVEFEKGVGFGPFRWKRRKVRIVELTTGEDHHNRLRTALQGYLESLGDFSNEMFVGEELEELIQRVHAVPNAGNMSDHK